jgi:hypothetical protein
VLQINMTTTLLTFFSRTELIEGDFEVSLNDKVGRIKVELFPKDGTERVAVSRVAVEIPYFIPENEYTNTGYVPPPTSPIKREALDCFNRFIDVLRNVCKHKTNMILSIICYYLRSLYYLHDIMAHSSNFPFEIQFDLNSDFILTPIGWCTGFSFIDWLPTFIMLVVKSR